MATYKVIQDIEAEDKFLGPLTLKQFIFGAIAVFFGYLSFFAITKGAYFLLPVFLTPVILGLFLAIPWSSDQPTEVWVLAKMRFKLKPKTRIWNQAGLEELVTITVPKKIEHQLTNGLDQTEVQSRLRALAETIDTRGWATKNATLNSAYALNVPQAGDRLINPASIPQQVPEIDTSGYNDVLDEDNSVSEGFDKMIQSSSRLRKQQSLEMMDRARRGEPLQTTAPQPVFTAPSESYAQPATYSAADEQLLAQRLRDNRSDSNLANNRLRTLSTNPVAYIAAQPQASAAQLVVTPAPAKPTAPDPVTDTSQAQAAMTTDPNPDILNLSQNNDLNIATLARQAKRNDSDNGEVVISLR